MLRIRKVTNALSLGADRCRTPRTPTTIIVVDVLMTGRSDPLSLVGAQRSLPSFIFGVDGGGRGKESFISSFTRSFSLTMLLILLS